MKFEFNKLNVKAIIWGFIADIGASTIFAFVFGIIAGVLYALNGGSAGNFRVDYYANIPSMLISLIIGLLCTTVGGYVAGKIAKRYEVLNSLAVGVLGLVIGVLFAFSLPLWYNLLGFILVIPSAYLGGVIAKHQNIAIK